MDWDKIRTFYYVAKAGSFTHAGELLNLTQSAVSRQILNLEEGLNMPLFQRHSRGLTLTKQGSILFEAARRMYQEVEAANNFIYEEGHEPEGPLKIAATMTFASLYIAPQIIQFAKSYPKIRLSVIASDVLPDLDLQEADAAIHPYLPNHPFLIQDYLLTFHLKLYASPEYLKEFGTPQTAQDLDKHRLLTYGLHTPHPFGNVNWHLSAGVSSGKLREPYIQLNSTVGLTQMAQAGLGIVCLAQEQPNLKDTGLVEVLSDVPGPVIEGYFIYSEQLKNSKRVKAFRDFLKEAVGTQEKKKK